MLTNFFKKLINGFVLFAYVQAFVVPVQAAWEGPDDLRIHIRPVRPNVVDVQVERRPGASWTLDPLMAPVDKENDGAGDLSLTQTFERGGRYGNRWLQDKDFVIEFGGLTFTIGFAHGTVACQGQQDTPHQSMTLETADSLSLRSGHFGANLTLKSPTVMIPAGNDVSTRGITYAWPKDGRFIQDGTLDVQGTLTLSGVPDGDVLGLLQSPKFKAKGLSATLNVFNLDAPVKRPETHLNVVATRVHLNANLDTKATRFETTDLVVGTDIKTNGTFEVWEPGLTTRDQVTAAMDARFGADNTQTPNSEYTLRLLKSIYAKGGIKFFTPRALVHMGDDATGIASELIVLRGNFDAYATKFDLEKGVLAAQRGTLRAPGGVHLGRLGVSPQKEVFITLFSHTNSYNKGTHNLGLDVVAPYYAFMGKNYTNVYDGYHLIVLPFVAGNNANIVFKENLSIKGNLLNQGAIETQDLEIFSHKESLCDASSIRVKRNFTLGGGGHLRLKRLTGWLHFYYHSYENNGATRLNAKPTQYLAVNSDAAQLNVGSHMRSLNGSSIINEGSIFHSHHNNAPVHAQNITTSQYQKVIEGSQAERNSYKNTYDPSRGYGSVAYPAYWPPSKVDWGHAIGFLLKTNNFAGSQNTFPAQTSIVGNTMVETNQLQGDVSLADALIVLSGQNPRLGSYLNAVKAESPLQDLGQGAYDQNRVTMNTKIWEDMRRAQEQRLRHETTDSFFFSLRERFWFDGADAQKFYGAIGDHLFTVTQRSLERIPVGALFSLSPNLLLESVRDACQRVLKRGFVYPNVPLDLAQVQEFHRNMTAFVQRYGLGETGNSRALVAHAPQFQDFDKPVIFYRGLMNGQGLMTFSPTVVFPQSLVARSGGISGRSILAITQGTSVQQIQALAQDTRIRHLLAPHMQPLLALAPAAAPELASGSELVPTSGNTHLQPMPQGTAPSPVQPVEVRGPIRADNFLLISDGRITNHATIEAANILLASLRDSVVNESLVERTYHANGFSDRISQETRLLADTMLFILAFQNAIFLGAHTQSGEEEHVTAFGDILDIPVSLAQEVVTTYYGRKKSHITNHRETQNHVSTHASPHTQWQAGGNILGQGTVFSGETLDVDGAQVDFQPAVNTAQTDSTFNSKKRHRKKKCVQETLVQQTTQPPVFNVAHTTIRSGGDVHLTQLHARGDVNVQAPKGMVFIRQGQNLCLHTKSRTKSNVAWNSAKVTQTQDVTYAPPVIDGKLTINAQRTLVEVIMGREREWMTHLEAAQGPLTRQYLREIHDHRSKKSQGPTVALSALVGLAITVATAANGAPIAAALGIKTVAVGVMAEAAVANLATQLTLGMASHRGDFARVLQDLTRTENLKSLAVDMVAAVATHGLCEYTGINGKMALARQAKQVPGFMLHLEKSFIQSVTQSAVRTGLNLTLPRSHQRMSFAGVLGRTVVSTLVNAGAAHGAGMIGQAYGGFEIDSWTHKGLHAVNGALMEGLRAGLLGDDPTKAALAGAIGAAVAETLAETIGHSRGNIRALALAERDRLGDDFDEARFVGALESTQRRAGHLAQVGAGLAAFLTHTDVAIAGRSATNAVENNWVFLIPVVMTGLTIAGVAYSAYEVKEAYDEGGIEAAAKVLGIEIITAAVGGAAIKGGVKGAKFLIKSAGIEVATLGEAVAYVLAHKPALREKLGNFAPKIIREAQDFARAPKLDKGKEPMPVASGSGRNFWKTEKTYTFNGQTNKVYKRDDLIDLNKVDPETGLTNRQIMSKGYAPLGPDNLPINLHHTIQTQNGALAEVAAIMHQKNHGVLHIWSNGSKGGVTRAEIRPEINRPEFNKWKSEYWKTRLQELDK